MGNQLKRLLRQRWVLPALFVLAAVAISAAGWLLVNGLKDEAPQFRLDAAKSALTVATGLVLGGALKFVLDSHMDAEQERSRANDRLHEQLTGLRNVHDRVESARLLIPAHRSASTYGDVMRDLIDSQVTLLDTRRTLETEPRSKTRRWNPNMANDFSNMVGYLQALHDEYRRNFKDASDAQHFDEELTDQDYRRVAAEELHDLISDGDGPPPAVPSRKRHGRVVPTSSNRAWTMLQDPKIFPVLHDFSAGGDAYRTYFLEPYHQVVRELLADPTEPRNRDDPRAEDAAFRQQTSDTSDTIRQACATDAEHAANELRSEPART